MSRLNRRRIQRSNMVAGLALGATLLLAFKLWSFSYFWTDDFGNAYWIQHETAGSMIGYILNPFSTFYRPVGLFAYWIIYHAFGWQPVPYHLVGWTLHSLNTVLVFLILRTLLRSPFAALAGTIPFAFRVNFADIYWSFGTIFELLACGLMLLGMYIYFRSRPSWSRMLTLCLIFMLAVKSKEMAISLVAVWILYDFFCGRKWSLAVIAPFGVGLWFTFLKVSTMRGVAPSDPYFIDLRFSTAVLGYGQYFNWLYGIKLPPAIWMLVAAAAACAMIYVRQRLGLFFLSYVFVTFLPVIFLANHRWPYFWYVPFFGISGLFGLAAKWLQSRLRARITLHRLVALNAAVLMIWAGIHSGVEYYRSRMTRAYESSLATALRSYVAGLRELDPVEDDATLYFTEMPPHFHAEVLNASVQVVLRRPDLHAKFVDAYPPEARWRLHFTDGVLRQEKLE